MHEPLRSNKGSLESGGRTQYVVVHYLIYCVNDNNYYIIHLKTYFSFVNKSMQLSSPHTLSRILILTNLAVYKRASQRHRNARA